MRLLCGAAHIFTFLTSFTFLFTFYYFVTGACAVAIPNLGDYIALIGAVSSSVLALILPPFIDILTTQCSTYHPIYDDDKEVNESSSRFQSITKIFSIHKLLYSKLTTAKDVLITAFGILGFVTGTIAAISNIITDLTNPSDDVCSGSEFPNITTTSSPLTTSLFT